MKSLNFNLLFFLVCKLFAVTPTEVALEQFNEKYESPGPTLVFKKLYKGKRSVLFGEGVESFKSDYSSDETERILVVRARLEVPFNEAQVNMKKFELAQTFTSLNRKTIFTKVGLGKYKAHRPSFFADVYFEMDLILATKDKNQKIFEEFKKVSGLDKELLLVVSQEFKNYNLGVVGSGFHFGIYKRDENFAIVDFYGHSALKYSLPDFVQRKMLSSYDDKIPHLQKQFEKLLSNEKIRLN